MTIIVLAVLMAIAMPNFRSVILQNKLSSQSNELLAALQYARLESMRRNVRVTVCQSANGTSCASSAAWAGWLVFADTDRDGSPDAGEPIRVGTLVAPTVMSASSNITNSRFNFYPDGLAREGATGSSLLNARLRYCAAATNLSPNARYVTVVSGSRIITEQANGGSTCAATLPNPS